MCACAYNYDAPDFDIFTNSAGEDKNIELLLGTSPERLVRRSTSVGNLPDIDVYLRDGMNRLTISENDNNAISLRTDKLQNGQPMHRNRSQSISEETKSRPPFESHAKPIPKSVKEFPKEIVKSMCTTSGMPVLKKRTAQVGTKVKKVGATKPVPFSFDEKIAEVQKKKEKWVLEKEKRHQEMTDFDLNRVFKAKPAKVLDQQPFIPKKSVRPLTEFVSYPSNWENRAEERKKFSQQLKEKEEMVLRVRKEIEVRRQELEAAEMARIRKQAVHQAKPIRQYKEVKKITPKKITDPTSPKFSYRRNKENISN